jgi:hypothetical protein
MTDLKAQLDRLEASVLQAARSGLSPTDEQRSAAFAQVVQRAASIGLDSEATLPNGMPAGEIVSRVSDLTWKGVLLGGVVGAMVGFGAGFVAFETRGPEQTDAPADIQTPEFRQTAAEVQSALKVALSTVPLESAQPPVPAPGAGGKVPSARAATAHGETSSPLLDEELSAVRQAQAALKHGNPGLALGLMRKLQELSPTGALLAERGVTEVLALCKLGRSAEAARVGAALLRRHPGSVYEARLRGSCAVRPEPAAASDE